MLLLNRLKTIGRQRQSPSGQSTSRHSLSVVFSDQGTSNAIRVRRVTPGRKTTLHTGMAGVSATLLVGKPSALIHRPATQRQRSNPPRSKHQVVFTLRVGTPKSITCFSCSVAVGQAWTQAPQETHSLSRNAFSSLGETFDFKASCSNRQSNRTLHLRAGSHAAAAHDALTGIKTKIRIGIILARLQMIRAFFVAHRAQTQPTPAISWSSQSPLAEQVKQSRG